MVSVPKAMAYTFEDFCALVREDQKADLIDGVIYMASEVLPGFWLCPEWLWQDPRPKTSQVLAQILAGQS